MALDSVAQSKLKLIFRIKCNDGLLLALQVDSGTAQCCYNTKVKFDLYAGMFCMLSAFLLLRVALDSVAQSNLNVMSKCTKLNASTLAVQFISVALHSVAMLQKFNLMLMQG